MSFRRLVRQYWRSGPYISPDGVLHLLSSDRSATIRFSLAFILELIDTSHFGRQQTPIFLRSIEVGPTHTQRKQVAFLALAQRLEGCIREKPEFLLVRHQHVPRLPRQIAKHARENHRLDV